LEIVKKPITLSKLLQIIQRYLNWVSIYSHKNNKYAIVRGTLN
jgi:hypothetical protein